MFLCLCPYSSFQTDTNEGLSSWCQMTLACAHAACKAAHQTPLPSSVWGEVNCCLPGLSRVWANTGEEAEPGTRAQLPEQTRHSDEVITSLVLLLLGGVLETINEVCPSPSTWGQCMCTEQSFSGCGSGQRPGLQGLLILPWDNGPHCCGKTACAFVSSASKAACSRAVLCCDALLQRHHCFSFISAGKGWEESFLACLSCRHSLNCL